MEAGRRWQLAKDAEMAGLAESAMFSAKFALPGTTGINVEEEPWLVIIPSAGTRGPADARS